MIFGQILSINFIVYFHIFSSSRPAQYIINKFNIKINEFDN
jgi:hypothetical protein